MFIFAVLLVGLGFLLDALSLYFGVCNVAFKMDKPSGVILAPFICYCIGIFLSRELFNTLQIVLAIAGALILHFSFQYPLIYLVSSIATKMCHRGHVSPSD